MISRRAALLPATAVGFLSISSGSIKAAEADRIDARFEIFGFADLHVLTNRTAVDETADLYTISMDLDSRGLASVFVDLTSHSEVHGRLGRDASYPMLTGPICAERGPDRHYGLDYRRDGAVISSAPPSLERPLLVAVEQTRGTVDQLTAYFILERQLADRGTCSRRSRIRWQCAPQSSLCRC